MGPTILWWVFEEERERVSGDFDGLLNEQHHDEDDDEVFVVVFRRF